MLPGVSRFCLQWICSLEMKKKHFPPPQCSSSSFFPLKPVRTQHTLMFYPGLGTSRELPVPGFQPGTEVMPALPTPTATQPTGNPPLHSHHIRHHCQPPYPPLSWPNPSIQKGLLQDILHCLLLGFGSLEGEQDKKRG